jgi:TorA maturation chaperone TorD
MNVIASFRTAANDAALDLACQTLFRFLSAAFSDPRSSSWPLLFDPESHALIEQAAEYLRSKLEGQPQALGFGELPPEALDVRELVAAATDPTAIGSDYLRVFGLVTCRECPPYETEYQPIEDTFFRSQQMADIAGFYRAFGLQLGAKARERPDHVALELEFLALLLMRKHHALNSAAEKTDGSALADICQQARASFVRDHFAWWVPSFSLALRKKAESGFFEAAGRVLAALSAIERGRLGIKPPQMPLKAKCEAPEECEACLATCHP